jgi:sugar lactone lactonase
VAAAILSEARCHLGEGATYDAARGTAWWFDILDRRLFEADIARGTVRIHALPVMGSALGLLADGRQVVASEEGVHLRDPADGRLALLHPAEHGPVPRRSNDGRVHPAGTFWFSMMGRHAEAGAGAIYALHAGTVHRLFPALSIPNAICFSADGSTGFFADTARHVLFRVTLDPATGLPADAPVPIHRHEGGGGLDGATIDAEGLIWIARWGGSRVDCFTPAGERVRSVAVPALQASCPVFVGADLDRLLVTSAWEHMDAQARAADPHGGKTFLVDPGARGRPEPRVRLGEL